MSEITVYNLKGEKKDKLSLPAKLFAAKENQSLIVQAVRVYLTNQRQGSARTKSRSEINCSGRKIYPQKGTGRARHGDRGAPIFVKGGRAHGPGKQNYKRKMSRKMKQAALFSALTTKLKNKEVLVVENLEKIKPKTKEMVKVLDKLLDRSKIKKITFVLAKKEDNILRAGRNIKGVKLIFASTLNTYQVLDNQKLIFTKDSLKVLKEIYGAE